jgi:hypothetical protein
MHFGGLCDDLGPAQYAFFMEMDEEDASAVGSSEIPDVNEGTCPYLQTAAQAQSILKSDRAQFFSIGWS